MEPNILVGFNFLNVFFYVNVLFWLGLFTTITAKIQSRIRFGMFKNPEK